MKRLKTSLPDALIITMARTIYTDKETNEIMERIRQNNPSFNFSEFFRQELIKYSNPEDFNDKIANIDKAILKLNVEIQERQLAVKQMEEQKIKIMVDEEQRKKEAEQIAATKAEIQNRAEQIKQNIMQIFKEEVGREMSAAEWEDYNNKERGNIYSYCEAVLKMRELNK